MAAAAAVAAAVGPTAAPCSFRNASNSRRAVTLGVRVECAPDGSAPGDAGVTGVAAPAPSPSPSPSASAAAIGSNPTAFCQSANIFRRLALYAGLAGWSAPAFPALASIRAMQVDPARPNGCTAVAAWNT